MSLSPAGSAYAATGKSGDVSLHSAEPGAFGQPLRTLASGRAKYGLRVAYVRALLPVLIRVYPR